jgi:hypothetical protein
LYKIPYNSMNYTKILNCATNCATSYFFIRVDLSPACEFALDTLNRPESGHG